MLLLLEADYHPSTLTPRLDFRVRKLEGAMIFQGFGQRLDAGVSAAISSFSGGGAT